MKTLHHAGASALVLAALLAAPLAQAADKLVVARDAETGQLRAPTAAEIDALKKLESKQRNASRSAARVGGIETRHSDGTVELSLGDDDMMSSIAVRQPDGSIAMECLPAKQADQIVRHPKAAVSPKSKPVQKDAAGHDLL
jgi:hypothetical protein